MTSLNGTLYHTPGDYYLSTVTATRYTQLHQTRHSLWLKCLFAVCSPHVIFRPTVNGRKLAPNGKMDAGVVNQEKNLILILVTLLPLLLQSTSFYHRDWAMFFADAKILRSFRRIGRFVLKDLNENGSLNEKSVIALMIWQINKA